MEKKKWTNICGLTVVCIQKITEESHYSIHLNTERTRIITFGGESEEGVTLSLSLET